MTSATRTLSSVSTQRLFFALWPPIDLSRELHRLADNALRGATGTCQRVAPENIHLTLAFLGVIDESFRECAEQTASAVHAEAFTLTLKQIGCWPKSGILWAGPEQAPEPLLRLVQVLTVGLGECGYQADKRPYAAHLTLARKARPRQSSYSIENYAWRINQFHLVQSTTHADGARYRIVQSWPLNLRPA